MRSKLLAQLKFLRGTALDLFGRTEERRMERQLIDDYRAIHLDALSKLSADNLALVVELASLPEQIRGFGHVKLASVEKVKARWRAIEQALGQTTAGYAGAQESSLTGPSLAGAPSGGQPVGATIAICPRSDPRLDNRRFRDDRSVRAPRVEPRTVPSARHALRHRRQPVRRP